MLYNSVAYKAAIDATGVDVSAYTDALDGLKIVAPVVTTVTHTDGGPLLWSESDYLDSSVYAATLWVYAHLSVRRRTLWFDYR